MLKVIKEALSHAHDDEELVFYLAQTLRQTIAAEREALIEFVANLELLPELVALLGTVSTRVRVEAAWSLTNIAASAGPYCNLLLKLGAPAKLLAALKDPSSVVQEQVPRSPILGPLGSGKPRGRLRPRAR